MIMRVKFKRERRQKVSLPNAAAAIAVFIEHGSNGRSVASLTAI
jgi:hypothetical protein